MPHRCKSFYSTLYYLRRLAYPTRLLDLKHLFGFSAENTRISITINQNKGHLLNNLTNLNWLNQDRVQYYAQSIKTKAGPVRNCWGFIDGRARAICRPSINQEKYFSGHKRHHCVKYQSVLCPDGI
jgi:hypothetical protein